ncbi:MAG: hypothetical protein M1825_004421 [Sarcosagium campestre]|nr:MAG: hypothetical protein M1825_004421 [Sarcosagium campestre]
MLDTNADLLDAPVISKDRATVDTRTPTHVPIPDSSIDRLQAGPASKRRRITQDEASQLRSRTITSSQQERVQASEPLDSSVSILPDPAPVSRPESPPPTSNLGAQGNETSTFTAASNNSELEKPSAKRKGRPPRKSSSKAKAANQESALVISEKPTAETAKIPRKRGRKRELTPENAETVEIAPSLVKMADLCRDRRTGKKSQRERDLEDLDWTAVVRKQRERKAQRDRGEIPPTETVDQMLDRVAARPAAPRMRLVDGNMVLDDSSLQVDRHANAAAQAETLEEIEENELTRKVNSGTWLKKEKKESWDEATTELFYRGIRMFGTDFMIVSKMIPGRTRRQIKLKFGKEEKNNPLKIRDALLGTREAMNLEVYSQHTNTQYEDPAVFQRELDEEAEKHALEQTRQEEAQQEVVRQKHAEIAEAAPTASESKDEGHQEKEASGSNPSKSTRAPRRKAVKAPAKRATRSRTKQAPGGPEIVSSIEAI